MTTMNLDEFLSSRGLKGSADVEQAFHEAIQNLPLAALRANANLTQKEIAGLLGKSQAAVSKFEGRGDFLISTLFQYVKALRGSIDLSISVGEGMFTLAPIDDEGEIYFKLMRKAASEAINSGPRQRDVFTLRSLTQNPELRSVPRRHVAWLSDHSLENYTSASDAISDVFTKLAANDEAQPLAA
ncbi:helix-turn-helix transcriptional regulator [Xanthomonas arboricola]|uniref:XRE family transcriptional regulator n=1 Tax=Xanthomonas arboricola TaxID=56448 RepID=A0A2S7AIG5_9XANT|nr:helix-turn-helix transcriptional regulator [Xanthomonas arboricola]MBB3850305.1 transcriptional regulator with XRE-family HTH domain [Xanthomonas arboricola]PPT24371.1 XRE family transcriptional regulator [Xanthomonas arboricola]PPT51090.1 XRE family transcriptional regulator [Xanthomonas arboricola]PPU09647.1 XRE family transcriptional regulator [Xanthomonas arboricola]